MEDHTTHHAPCSILRSILAAASAFDAIETRVPAIIRPVLRPTFPLQQPYHPWPLGLRSVRSHCRLRLKGHITHASVSGNDGEATSCPI